MMAIGIIVANLYFIKNIIKTKRLQRLAYFVVHDVVFLVFARYDHSRQVVKGNFVGFVHPARTPQSNRNLFKDVRFDNVHALAYLGVFITLAP